MDEERCKHSSLAIVARMLRRQTRLEVMDAIYRLHCPWDHQVRRLTRVSNDIWHLRHNYQWDIDTERHTGRLAVYVLRGEGLTPPGLTP